MKPCLFTLDLDLPDEHYLGLGECKKIYTIDLVQNSFDTGLSLW